MRDRTYLTDEPVRLGPLLFLRSVRRVLGLPPLWLLTSAILALLAAPVGLAWRAFVAEATEHRYMPDRVVTEIGDAADDSGELDPFLWDDQVHSLTASFRHDHAAGLAGLERTTGHVGGALAFLALLVGVFAAGGWLQVMLERARGRAMWRFFLGGARYFFRFLRLFVLSLVLLAAWQWLIYGPLWDQWVLGRWQGIPEADWERLESLESELSARALVWARDGVHALGFALVLAWGTFARTRMALLDGVSALKAGFLTAIAIGRHPVKTLGPLVSLFGLELLLVSVACGRFARWLEEGLQERPSQGLVAAMGLVGILALMIREVLRGARYHAAVKVSQAIVRRRPLEPDPWRSIGGPGGPQYPVDEVDGETWVAM